MSDPTFSSPPGHGDGASPTGVGSWYGNPCDGLDCHPVLPTLITPLKEMSSAKRPVSHAARDGLHNEWLWKSVSSVPFLASASSVGVRVWVPVK